MAITSSAGSTSQWTPQVDVTSPSFQTDLQDALNRLSQSVGALQQAASQPAPAAQSPAASYDVPINLQGSLSAGAVYNATVFTRKVKFQPHFAGSQAQAGTGASGNAQFTLTRISGGTATDIGTVTMSPSGMPQFASAHGEEISFEPGDHLQVTMPSPADASLASVMITLSGTLDS